MVLGVTNQLLQRQHLLNSSHKTIFIIQTITEYHRFFWRYIQKLLQTSHYIAFMHGIIQLTTNKNGADVLVFE